MHEVFITTGRDPSNVRRRIWLPSLPVLPIVHWLEVRMAPPATVNGVEQALRLPHEGDANGWKTPDLSSIVFDDSWVPDCIRFTGQFIEEWPERQKRYPALAKIDSKIFVRLQQR
jgi:hypothetical protein